MKSIFHFCLCFRISSSNSFWDTRLIKICLSKKILRNFGVWIDLTLIRFDRKARLMRQRVASTYGESNDIFGNFLRRLLKICIQIKWICQIKRDSLVSLVHNNLFHFLDMTTGCVYVSWIQWYFWKFSTTFIKDLYTNKVNCAKQKYK